ncbi:hypothetical protein, partial [Streptomyces hirsutus]|uniref:hypothetical protein n=1 Tax=Streptomyces hirsutus TaxID=35620 RepID=UPI0036AFB4BD
MSEWRLSDAHVRAAHADRPSGFDEVPHLSGVVIMVLQPRPAIRSVGREGRVMTMELFPSIPLAEWRDTKETLHRFAQIV